MTVHELMSESVAQGTMTAATTQNALAEKKDDVTSGSDRVPIQAGGGLATCITKEIIKNDQNPL